MKNFTRHTRGKRVGCESDTLHPFEYFFFEALPFNITSDRFYILLFQFH